MATSVELHGQNSGEIPMRPLGKAGLSVSALWVGGYHLGSADDLSHAKRIVDEAIDSGINYFDNCWDFTMVRAKSG